MSPDRERPRPMSIRRGPAPIQEPPKPGMRRVVFHFDGGGDVGVTFPEAMIGQIRRGIGEAWNSPEGQMFTIAREDGTPSVLIHLGKVRFVEIQ